MASAGGGANRGRPPAATSTAGEGGDPAGEPLVGDGVTVGIVRIGDNVRRPARPFTATIRAFLAHLHESGFTAAPVPLGLDDQGREVLSFVPGDGPREPLPAETATDEVLIALATLIRGLHDAAAGWIPPAGAVWGGLPGAAAVAVAPADGEPELVSHRDYCPLDRAPAFTDLDIPARVAVFADAHGMTGRQRRDLLPLATWMVHRFHVSARTAAAADRVFRRMWEEDGADRMPRAERWLAPAAPGIAGRLLGGVS